MLFPFSIYSVAKQNWLPNLNYDDTLAHSVSLQGCNLTIILICYFMKYHLITKYLNIIIIVNN